MATQNNNHSIPKENQQTDNEDSQTNHNPQDSSQVERDKNDSFSAHPNEDNSGGTTTDYTARSSPDETQTVIESTTIGLENLKMENESNNSSTFKSDNDSNISAQYLLEADKLIKIDNTSYVEQFQFTRGLKNTNMNLNDFNNELKPMHSSRKKKLNISDITHFNTANIYSEVSGSKDVHVNTEAQKLPKVPGKRDIIILHMHKDRNRAHVFQERIKGIWRSEAQSNDIIIDLEMEVAIGLSEMTLDNKLFDVYRIILVYLTQSFDVDEHRRFRMESILKESHKRHGNLSRRVIPVWIDVDPGQSQHIQLNILQGLSADSDTEIKHLLRLLASDSE